MRRLRDIPLRTRIALLVALGLFGVFGFLGLLGVQAIHESTQRTARERLLITRVIASHFDALLSEQKARVQRTASTIGTSWSQGDLEAVRREIAALQVDLQPGSPDVALLDQSGAVLLSEPATAAPLARGLPAKYIGQALDAGSVIVTGVTNRPEDPTSIAPAERRPLVALVAPVVAPSGLTIGLLSANLELAHPGSDPFIGAAQNLGPTGHGELVDQDDVVIAASNPSRLFTPGEHPDFYRPLLAERKEGFGSTLPVNDRASGKQVEPHVMAFSPLEEAPWGLSLGVTQGEMFASVQQWQAEMLLMAGAFLGAALVLVWITTRSVIDPVKRLTTAAQRIAEGNLEDAVPATGEDELGRLTRAFETMRTQLKTSREEIARWNGELEKRLERQTSELADLFAAAEAMATTLDREAFLTVVIAHVREICPNAAAGALLLCDTETGHLAPVACFGLDAEPLKQIRLKPEGSLVGDVFCSGQPALVSHKELGKWQTRMDPVSAALFAQAGPQLTLASSALCVPLRSKQESLGVLIVYDLHSPTVFTETDVRVLSALADWVAIALQNARLFSIAALERLGLEATVDLLSDGFMTLDLNRRIVTLNPAGERLLGWKTEEVQGRDCSEIIAPLAECGVPPCREDCPAEPLRDGLMPGAISKGIKVNACRRDGSRFPCLLNTRVGRDESGNPVSFIHTFRDLTAEERYQAETERRLHELESLYAIAQSFGAVADRQEIYLQLTERVARALGARHCLIAHIEGEDLVAQSPAYGIATSALSAFRCKARPALVAVLKGQTPDQSATGGQVTLGEIGGGSRSASTSRPPKPEAGTPQELPANSDLAGRTVPRTPILQQPTLSAFGARGALAVPLQAQGKVLGILYVAGKPQGFNPDDRRLLGIIAGQVAVAVENSRLYAEIQRREFVRGQLLGRVIEAQEEERKRVARDLHDVAGQALSAAVISLGAVAEALPAEQNALRQRANGAKTLVTQALEEVRGFILDLRPMLLDDLGLVAAVRSYAESHLEPLGVTVSFKTTNVNDRLPSEVETVVFRVLQEAVNNVARHAKAAHTLIQLNFGADRVTAIVEDDGCGFDVGEVVNLRREGRTEPLGLLGLGERLSLVNGRVQIDSQPGRGTRLTIDVPLGPEKGA